MNKENRCVSIMFEGLFSNEEICDQLKIEHSCNLCVFYVFLHIICTCYPHRSQRTTVAKVHSSCVSCDSMTLLFSDTCSLG